MHYHRGATTITDGLGLGQRKVCLGASWRWLCQTYGKFLAHPKSCHINPIQLFKNYLSSESVCCTVDLVLVIMFTFPKCRGMLLLSDWWEARDVQKVALNWGFNMVVQMNWIY